MVLSLSCTFYTNFGDSGLSSLSQWPQRDKLYTCVSSKLFFLFFFFFECESAELFFALISYCMLGWVCLASVSPRSVSLKKPRIDKLQCVVFTVIPLQVHARRWGQRGFSRSPGPRQAPALFHQMRMWTMCALYRVRTHRLTGDGEDELQTLFWLSDCYCIFRAKLCESRLICFVKRLFCEASVYTVILCFFWSVRPVIEKNSVWSISDSVLLWVCRERTQTGNFVSVLETLVDLVFLLAETAACCFTGNRCFC